MENKEIKIAYRRKGLLFGGLLIVGGILFLLSNINTSWQIWKPIIFSWQMLIILIGFSKLCWRRYFMGTFIMLVGIFFLMPVLASAFPMNFGGIPTDFTQRYWALLIVFAGVLIVLHVIFGKNINHRHHWGRHYRYRYYKNRQGWNQNNFNSQTSFSSADGTIERESVFSGSNEIFLEPEFRGGRISCFCGGFTLNLRKTALPEGETVLNIHCVCGGVIIYVPDNWKVEIRTSNVMGGSSDSRLRGREIDQSRKLIIVGDCVLGGVEIK